MNAAASADLLRLIAALAEPPAAHHVEYAAVLGLDAPADLNAWRVAHAAAFIEQCPPFASTIVGEGGQIGGAAADRVADFRRLLGADVAQAPDALPALLADYAELVERADADARAGHARAALLWEHLLSWTMPYLDALARSAPAPYAGWAQLLADVLAQEARTVPAPADLPLALRDAPAPGAIADAESADGAIRALLVPAATGIVLTRADLARAVIALEAGLVQKTRAFILRHLMDQDAPGALDWLAAEARRQAEARTEERDVLAAVAEFWIQRARRTAAALSDMAQAARGRDTAADHRIASSG